MSAAANYNELLNSMREANVGFKPPAVLDDVVNDKAVVGKSALEGVSSQLVGGSLAGSLKALTKNKSKLAKTLNIKEEDIDKIIESAAKGDLKGVTTNTSDAAIRAANQTLQDGIGRAGQALKSGGKSIAEAFGRSPKAMARDVYENLDPEEFLGLSTDELKKFGRGEVPERFQQEAQPQASKTIFTPADEEPETDQGFGEAAADYARNLKASVQGTLQKSREDLDPFSSPTTLSQEAQGAAEDTLDAAKSSAADLVKGTTTGEKVVTGLEDAAEASAASDFDPVNLAITGALGLAGVIGGLFVKTHHTVNRATPEILPVNYGSQLF